VSLSAKLRKAQKNLKAAKREVDKLQKQHLEALLNKAIVNNQHKRTKALKYLICAEQNCLCYARFRQHTKPKAAGGLAYITVPDDTGTPQPLLDKQDLESMLLEHSRTHFAQAEGSPFTIEPLNCLLQYDGLTPYGDHVTQGKSGTLHDFDKPTGAILKHLQCKVLVEAPVALSLNHDILLNGIKMARTYYRVPLGTSPWNLQGTGKNVIDNKKDNKDQATPATNTGTLKDGCNVLYIIFDLMELALRHTYPLKRWRKVWTIFIEKELGNPDIDRLRCIMIFEANWQLLLKYQLSYGFLPKTEEVGQLVPEQGGGRKGRSTIDQATQQVVETEITHLNQRTTLDLYLNLCVCFDLMVEACHNLACR